MLVMVILIVICISWSIKCMFYVLWVIWGEGKGFEVCWFSLCVGLCLPFRRLCECGHVIFCVDLVLYDPQATSDEL